MKNKRFEFRERSGLNSGTSIIVDNETGVQYLFAWSGYAGGITLLVDKDGKPMLDSGNQIISRKNVLVRK